MDSQKDLCAIRCPPAYYQAYRGGWQGQGVFALPPALCRSRWGLRCASTPATRRWLRQHFGDAGCKSGRAGSAGQPSADRRDMSSSAGGAGPTLLTAEPGALCHSMILIRPGSSTTSGTSIGRQRNIALLRYAGGCHQRYRQYRPIATAMTMAIADNRR